MRGRPRGYKCSPETCARMSAASKEAAEKRRLRMQSTAPAEPTAPAGEDEQPVELPALPRSQSRAKLPPARELARVPTRKQLNHLPANSVTLERWAQAQTEYETVAGWLLRRITWPLGGADRAVYRFRLAARLHPELGITDDLAAAAAEQMIRQWRAFQARLGGAR